MNFNYRDFFIHNDDLHIIKEELSILDEMGVSKEDALSTNAKAVWDMYQNELDEQKIADKLKINVEAVKKIIQICLMNTVNNMTSRIISDKLNIGEPTVYVVLKNAMGEDFKRQKDKYFVNDAVKIVDIAEKQMTEKGKIDPDEIVNLVNKEKKENYEKIDLNKVNTVLKIVDMAKKQMTEKGEVNIREIHQEIVIVYKIKISEPPIAQLIKQLKLGEIRTPHKFTEEQDVFILFNYLQRIGPTASAILFNDKFKLDISFDSISNRLKKNILKPKGESEISEYALKLLKIYKDTYFQTVDIENSSTKELLTHYIPPERIKGRDPLARKGGNVDSTRNISGYYGNLEPDIHQTFYKGEIPASGQLGKKSGAPIKPQGALSL